MSDPAERHRMPHRRGSHVAYARGADLVVEWYDFGPHAPYESANLLVFGPPAQAEIAAAIDTRRDSSPDALASHIAARFDSYFDVKRFAEEHRIPFAEEVDFQP